MMLKKKIKKGDIVIDNALFEIIFYRVTRPESSSSKEIFDSCLGIRLNENNKVLYNIRNPLKILDKKIVDSFDSDKEILYYLKLSMVYE